MRAPYASGLLARFALGSIVVWLASCADPSISPGGQDAAAPALAPPKTWSALLIGAGRKEPAFDNAIGRFRQALIGAGIPSEHIRTLSARRHQGAPEPSIANMRQEFAALPRGDDTGCLLYVSGHGDERGMQMEISAPYAFSPSSAAQLLREFCGQRPTVAIFSGCHTGVFVEGRMPAANRVILTAARRDRSSFGCNAGAELTVFDRCFLRRLAGNENWRELQRAVSNCVARWEDLLHFEPPSTPQSFFGRQIADHQPPSFPPSAADLLDPDRAQLARRAETERRRLKTLSLDAASFGRETENFGVSSRFDIDPRRSHGPTPLSLPGTRTITTAELKARLDDGRPFHLIDVLGAVANTRPVIPGAHWVPNMGSSDWSQATARNSPRAKSFRAILGKIAPSLDEPIAFYCANTECWLSYYAALHALRLGYRNVYWYRGGVEAWRTARLPFVPAAPEETPS